MSDEQQNDRKWFGKAAVIWVDMKRGLYDWPKARKPKADGTYPVVKTQILKDLDLDVNYHNQKVRIWANPYFLRAVELEERRRDLGIANVVKEIEAIHGPLHKVREDIQKNMQDIFSRPPDAEDPQALSPRDYVSQGMSVIRYIDETEGRTEAAKAGGIEHIMSEMATTNRVNAEMVGAAFEILKTRRAEQDRMLGVIEGSAEECE